MADVNRERVGHAAWGDHSHFTNRQRSIRSRRNTHDQSLVIFARLRRGERDSAEIGFDRHHRFGWSGRGSVRRRQTWVTAEDETGYVAQVVAGTNQRDLRAALNPLGRDRIEFGSGLRET